MTSTAVTTPEPTPTRPFELHSPPDWLRPISAHEPCGPSLEYDPEYAVLSSRLAPQADAQYGSFVGTPEAPNWPEIERDCQRLLLRSKDIHVIVWLCRARTRLGQAAGLAFVLGMLRDLLQAHPETAHPQLMIEGQAEPVVRGNALAGLVDPEGLLADVFDIVVASSSAMRLTVRDVERAFLMPRAADAPSPESVTRQLAALRSGSGSSGAASTLDCLALAADDLHAIEALARAQLGDEAPSLKALSGVLDLFKDPAAPAPVPANESLASLPRETRGLVPPCGESVGTREEVQASIRAARAWFERHEPSSPVAVLLMQAERLVGKRFSQIADSIPLDLLRKWESGDAGEEEPT